MRYQIKIYIYNQQFQNWYLYFKSYIRNLENKNKLKSNSNNEAVMYFDAYHRKSVIHVFTFLL